MKKPEVPMTAAVRFLRRREVKFEPFWYTYEEHGGTPVAARALGIPEERVVKTILLETDEKKPLLVLMHGDREVSTKKLARFLGVKSIGTCDERNAERLTGYVFGGMTPFGTRTPLPVYIERTIFDMPILYINGGKRGFLVGMNPADLGILSPVAVEVGVSPE